MNARVIVVFHNIINQLKSLPEEAQSGVAESLKQESYHGHEKGAEHRNCAILLTTLYRLIAYVCVCNLVDSWYLRLVSFRHNFPKQGECFSS